MRKKREIGEAREEEEGEKEEEEDEEQEEENELFFFASYEVIFKDLRRCCGFKGKETNKTKIKWGELGRKGAD